MCLGTRFLEELDDQVGLDGPSVKNSQWSSNDMHFRGFGPHDSSWMGLLARILNWLGWLGRPSVLVSLIFSYAELSPLLALYLLHVRYV